MKSIHILHLLIFPFFASMAVNEQAKTENMPVFCYHNIKKEPVKKSLYTTSEEEFEQHMKWLYDNGYQAILPEQLYLSLSLKHPLPKKSFMLTFDDNHAEHYSRVAPILDRYGFKGVFFIMTIAIDKPHYLTAANIRSLADQGHTIGCHTWDHPNLTSLANQDFTKQLDKPKQLLEKISGKPVNYFAYPFGAWNETVIQQLKRRGFKAAFQLSGKQSQTNPLFTINRTLVSDWRPVVPSYRTHHVYHYSIKTYETAFSSY